MPTTRSAFQGTEADLCALAIPWLSAPPRSYDVHQEVMPAGLEGNDTTGPIDLVCVKAGGEIIAIEAKRSFCADVIGQASSRRRYAHYAVVMTPEPKVGAAHSHGCRALLDACRAARVGVLFIRINEDTGEPSFVMAVTPTKNNNAKTEPIMDALCEATRKFNRAGSPSGVRRFNNGQSRWDYVRDHLAMHGPCTGKFIKSAFGLNGTEFRELLKAGKTGAIANVVTREERGLMHFRLKESP
jgi:hypothetical protein